MLIPSHHNQNGPAVRQANKPDSLVAQGALHEVFSARPADAAAAACFTLGLVRPGRLVWLRQELVQVETGALYAPGLATLGHDPAQTIVLTLRDAQSILQAGLEAARTKGLSAVVIEFWGTVKPYTLTASRRLVLAAKTSGASLYIINHAAAPSPSAAETRWQVKRLPAHALAGNAPGLPAFEVTLLRHRHGPHAGQVWSVEWNHEKRCFENRRHAGLAIASPLFKPVFPLPVFRKVPLRRIA